MTKKALSRAGLEPALSGPDFNLSDREFKKKEEKELAVCACLLAYQAILASSSSYLFSYMK